MKHFITLGLFLLIYSFLPAQNGRYDLRLITDMQICPSTFTADVEIRASSDSNSFFLGQQNYIFSISDTLAAELDVSIQPVNLLPASSLYIAQYVNGGVDSVVNLDVLYIHSGGSSFPFLVDTNWVKVARLTFLRPDPGRSFEFIWHDPAQGQMPQTLVSEWLAPANEQPATPHTFIGPGTILPSPNASPCVVDSWITICKGTSRTWHVEGCGFPTFSEFIIPPVHGVAYEPYITGGFISYQADPNYVGKDSFYVKTSWGGAPSCVYNYAWMHIDIDGCDCPGDIFELNEDYRNPAPLSVIGSFAKKYICRPGDLDWYIYDHTEPGRTLSFLLHNLPENYDLTVYEDTVLFEALEDIQSGTTNEVVKIPFASTGRYYILVKAHDSNTWDDKQPYSLTVQSSWPAPSGAVGLKPLLNQPILKEGSGTGSLTLYPNPAQSKCMLDISSDIRQTIQLSVMDISGRSCYQEILELPEGQTQHSLDVTELTAGIYQVRIVFEDNILNRKLLIID